MKGLTSEYLPEVEDDYDRFIERMKREEPARDSWDFVSLDDYLSGKIKHDPPTILHRPDGAALFYPRKRHLLVGDGEVMKTWMVLMAGIEVMKTSGIFFALDYENTPEESIERLLALGATRDMLHTYFRLMTPEEPITDKESKEFAERIATISPAFSSIDSVGAGMGLNALDPNDGLDWYRWRHLVVAPVFDGTIGAVVAIDHRSKDKTQRTAIGTVAKRNSFDVEIVVDAVLPFGRGMTGRSHVYVGKDRAGHLRATSDGGKFFGTLVLTANREGTTVTGGIQSPSSASAESSQAFIETQEEAQVMKLFADGGSRMRGAVDAALGCAKDKSLEILRRLEAKGKLQQHGKGRNTTYSSVIVGSSSTDDVSDDSGVPKRKSSESSGVSKDTPNPTIIDAPVYTATEADF